MQLPKSRDPADIEFVLRTNTGVSYPPLAVEVPVFVRDVGKTFDPSAPAAVVYSYVIRFPIRGGPGIPGIGPNVSELLLIVRDGDFEGWAEFPLKEPYRFRRR